MKQMLRGVPILQGKEFRESKGVQELKSLNIDYLLSVHFPYVIPKEVFTIPRLGSLNLHPALLPFNRGWHTPTWAIIEGTPYAATLHWISEGVDTGDIAFQKKIEILPHETTHVLYQRILELELKLLKESIPFFFNISLPRIPQHTVGSFHLKENLHTIQKFDLSKPEKTGDIIKKLLTLTTNNWEEAAYYELNGKRYYIRVETKEVKTEKSSN